MFVCKKAGTPLQNSPYPIPLLLFFFLILIAQVIQTIYFTLTLVQLLQKLPPVIFQNSFFTLAVALSLIHI